MDVFERTGEVERRMRRGLCAQSFYGHRYSRWRFQTDVEECRHEHMLYVRRAKITLVFYLLVYGSNPRNASHPTTPSWPCYSLWVRPVGCTISLGNRLICPVTPG